MSPLNDLVVHAYFKQLEFIVRGGDRNNALQQFDLDAQQCLANLKNQGVVVEHLGEDISALRNSLLGIEIARLSKFDIAKSQLAKISFRKLFYCLLGSLLCVLSLYIVEHLLTK
jgi:hypothetical protein